MEEHKDFYLSNQEVGVGILLETGCFFEAPNFSSLLKELQGVRLAVENRTMSEWMFWLQIPLIQLNLPFWGGPTAIHEKNG